MLSKYYTLKLKLFFMFLSVVEKLDPVKKIFVELYQICTPWLGVKRKLMQEVCANYGKLLSTGLSKVSQRTRDGKSVYYVLTTYFGYAKFYKVEYINKLTNRNVNSFVSIFVPALSGDSVDNIIMKKTCLYKGWVLTPKQGLMALKALRKKSVDLHWDSPACDEHSLAIWAKAGLDYLSGKHAYFMYQGITKTECEKELRCIMYLMLRDVKDKEHYVNQIQECMYLALEKQSTSRDLELQKRLKTLLIDVEKAGYKHFWAKYYK